MRNFTAIVLECNCKNSVSVSSHQTTAGDVSPFVIVIYIFHTMHLFQSLLQHILDIP